MQQRKKIIKNIFVVAGLTGAVISITPLAAQLLSSENSLQSSNHSHLDANRFTEIGGNWPPQPKNMENIGWLRDSKVRRSNFKSKTDKLATKLSGDDVPELGDRFTFISTESLDEKNSSKKKRSLSSPKMMTFFSHSNNATVEVKVNQGIIENVEQIHPSKYQPPLTVKEVKDAVKIAQKALQKDGYSRIQQLEGYGILAFKPASESTSENGGFFDTRVVYVSFHEHVDARPEFVAWVDLTEGTVIKSREDRL